MTKVLVFGLGGIGAAALDLIARSPEIDAIVTSQRDKEKGEHLTHIVAVGATFQGHQKHFEFQRSDVLDVDSTARLVAQVKPDVILTSVTLQSPRVLMLADVDPNVRARLREATFSIWLPWHALPVARLMEAIAKAQVRSHVVNIAFPDVVNPMIWRGLGSGPTLGAGNVEMIAASLQRRIAEDLSLPLNEIEITIITSHAFLAQQARRTLPSFIRIRVRGEDQTAHWNIYDVLDEPDMVAWARTSVFAGFAASAAKNVAALCSTVPRRTTVTAPNGLPGGYPARVSREGVQLDLPNDISVDEAIRINEAGNRFDGIEEIRADGTVVYTAKTREIMREFGYACDPVGLDELESRANDLKAFFARVVRREVVPALS